ncbi:MAG: HigA family addiction module antidote protein [Bacteroidales bacterium]|nr:HigA family addiction module antidote protein [Bacteroidales bacterium]
METKNENIQVCMAVPAGFTLAQELKSRQISQREFAKTIEMQATHLNEILKGKRNITPAIALKLENALGIKASFWMNLQSQYECDLQRLKSEDAKIESKKTRQDDSLFKFLLSKTGQTYSSFLASVKQSYISEHIGLLTSSERKRFNLSLK